MQLRLLMGPRIYVAAPTRMCANYIGGDFFSYTPAYEKKPKNKKQQSGCAAARRQLLDDLRVFIQNNGSFVKASHLMSRYILKGSPSRNDFEIIFSSFRGSESDLRKKTRPAKGRTGPSPHVSHRAPATQKVDSRTRLFFLNCAALKQTLD